MKLLIVAALLAPGVAAAEPLELVCRGVAHYTVDTSEYGTASAMGTNGQSATASSQTFSERPVQSQETMRVSLDGAGGGRIKLPKPLVPTFSRGNDGWWAFSKLDVGDAEIRAQMNLNIINHPSVVIDRRTGDIDYRAVGSRFTGACEKVETAPEARKF